MLVRCMHCHTPFTLTQETMYTALDQMEQKGWKHYNAYCPRCGRSNVVPKDQLRRFAPDWSPDGAPAASVRPPVVSVPAQAEPKPAPAASAPAPKPQAKPAAKKAAAKPAAGKPAPKPKAKAAPKAKAKPAAKKPAAKKTPPKKAAAKTKPKGKTAKPAKKAAAKKKKK